MRLVIANPWGERLGGAENILWALLRHLDTARVEPLVVFFDGGPFVDEVAGVGIPTRVLQTRRLRRGGRFVGTSSRLRRLLAHERPDAILGWGPKPQIYVGPVSASLGLSRRNVWMLLERPGHPVHRIASRLPAAAIACLSTFIQRDVKALAPRAQTFVVHPGIELPREPSDGAVAEVRDRLGVPPDKTVIGMVARLAPVKGQHQALAALAELRSRGVAAHLLLVGGDAHGLAPRYPAALRELAASLGVESDVTFTGQVSDPTPYIGLFDVALSTAPDEGFGIALLEAMALGVPVVAVDAGGPREIIENGLSGLLVDSSASEALAPALERLARDPGLREVLGSAARGRVREHFTAERMAADVTRHLGEVVARNGR